MHGDNKVNHLLNAHLGFTGLFLHAKRLTFNWANETFELEARLPQKFEEAIEQLNRFSIMQ